MKSFIPILIFIGFFAQASGDHDHGGEEKEFEIKSEAAEFLKIKTQKIQKENGRFKVPKESLVYFQSDIGVYVKGNGHFKMIEVTSYQLQGQFAFIQSKELNDGDDVVVSGVSFVRIAHLEATGQGGQGHAH